LVREAGFRMLQRVAQTTNAVLDRLIDALVDPRRRERSVQLLLAAYCAVWSLYGAISKSSQDIHFDMGEAVVWSREALLANPKHPPLSAWIPWLWFQAFPAADWAYYLLCMVLATIALWVAWKISTRFLSPEKQVAGLALLTLVPFFNFQALKYNANTVLIPLWALATGAFLHSFATRRSLPAALAGLAAAAAMLGKYWSIFLLAGLGLAALTDPRRRAYFRSIAPWITIVVGALALSPHVMWLINQGSVTFSYALAAHPGTYGSAFVSGLGYIVGTLGYAAVPAMIAGLATLPSQAALADTLWPRELERRFVAVAFWTTILLPAVAAVVAQTRIVPLWSIGGMTLLPVILLSSPLLTLSRQMVRRILGIAIALPLVVLLASPIVAIVIHQRGVENYAEHYQLIAQAVERTWRADTGKPLRVFGSVGNILHGASFYLSEKPKTYEIVTASVTPWSGEQEIARDGAAIVCPAADPVCMSPLRFRAARTRGAKRTEVEISRMFLGVEGKRVRYVIVTVPPR
jgi:4-amino-4-deoxy-L-arabinose transferase-like glycosyltransferase